MTSALDLDLLPGEHAVARLDPGAAVPQWAHEGALCALVRTAAELTILCAAAAVPASVRHEGPFTALVVRGPLDFGATGILAALAGPLAAAAIPILALSTFDTDIVLVRTAALEAAVLALEGAGHRIHR